MKRIIALLIINILTYNSSHAIAIAGSLIGERREANDINRYRVQFASDRLPYVNGGLTFAYPFNFPEDPTITISLELSNGPAFNPATTYSAIVTDNSLGSCIVRVTKAVQVGGVVTISEATSGEVIVSLLAIEDPV